MDRRLVRGGLAAVAALALGVGGSTLSAFDDFTDVPCNTLGAGVLLLDLDAAGGASTSLTVESLLPGQDVRRLLWIATNDASSTPGATLAVTLHALHDSAGPCDTSRGKALAEIASGIAGCAVDGDAVSGTPAQGNLSRVLDLGVSYGSVGNDPAACTAGTSAPLPVTGRGNLHALAAGAGTTVGIGSAQSPVVIAPGQGVCVEVDLTWPQRDAAPDADHPTDGAAEGDSLTVDLRFDLSQVQS